MEQGGYGLNVFDMDSPAINKIRNKDVRSE